MALIEHIISGNLPLATALLESNPEVAAERGPDGVSAARTALYRGYADLGREICDQDSKLDLFDAAAFGLVNELVALADHTDCATFSADGYTALHFSAFFGQVAATRVLLAHRAPVDAISQNPMGVTPLHSALANKHEGVARELVHEGANVNLESASGWTPLHYAVEMESKPLILFLLEHGAIPKSGPDNRTPQQQAIDNQNPELAALFAVN